MKGISYFFFFFGLVMVCMIKDEFIYLLFFYCLLRVVFGLGNFFYVIGIDNEFVLCNVIVVGFF